MDVATTSKRIVIENDHGRSSRIDTRRKIPSPPLTLTFEQSWSNHKVVASVPRLESESTIVQGFGPGPEGALFKWVSTRDPWKDGCLCGVLYLEYFSFPGFFVLWGFEEMSPISMSGSCWWENSQPFVLLSKSLGNDDVMGSVTMCQTTDSQGMLEQAVENLADFFPKHENQNNFVRLVMDQDTKVPLQVENVGDSSELLIGDCDGNWALLAKARIKLVTFLGRTGYHLVLRFDVAS